MSTFPFQDLTARCIEQKLKKSNVIALADEAGLGKTHVLVSLLANKISKKQNPKPMVVFYVASNLVLANENAKKLEKFLNSALLLEKDVFVHRIKYSLDGRQRPVRRISELPSKSFLKPGINIVALTPATSLTARSHGTLKEKEMVNKFNDRRADKLNSREARLRLFYDKIESSWCPDFLILDEYQSYSQAIRWEHKTEEPDSLVPMLITKLKVPTILVSATPFELKLPDPTHEVKIDDRKKPMSFDIFADILCRYSIKAHTDLLNAQKNYALAWETILYKLAENSETHEGIQDEALSLEKARDSYQALLKPLVVRTARSDLAVPQITFEVNIDKLDSKKVFGDLTAIHLASHNNIGWDVNAHIFSSSLNFFEYSEKGKRQDMSHYALGKGISKSGKKRLSKVTKELFEENSKGKLLKEEMVLAGLDTSAPPLWVTPSLTKIKKHSEKILIFSAFKAVPIEICQRLKDIDYRLRKPWDKWYISSSSTPEEVSLFWLRPGYALEKLKALDSASNADSLAIEYIISSVRGDEKKNKGLAKIFENTRQAKSWKERTNEAPGVQIIDSLIHVLTNHGVNKSTLKHLFSTEAFISKSVKLKRSLDRHFGNPRALKIIRTALGQPKAMPVTAYRSYFKKFLWKEVWVEYIDQLIGAQLERLINLQTEDLVSIVCMGLEEATEALSIKPLVHKGTDGKRWTCHFANHLGAKLDAENEGLPTRIRSAFNSPFGPFVLATTSIGEEGLDFHRYCRRQVHWDPPSTGSSLAQRIGRIVRFRGLLQRRELRSQETGFIWKKNAVRQTDGLIPNFQLQSKRKVDFPRVMLFAVPFTTQFKKAKEVKKHYEDLKYFIGMTPEQLEKILPLLVDKVDPKIKKELGKYVVNLKPII